eukprot:352225-Chlamydomonas_euryale.AAC.2
MPRALCTQVHERVQTLWFRVGDVVCHRRYGYAGVVADWDAQCSTREEWIQQMGVDSLPGGRQQVWTVGWDAQCTTREQWIQQMRVDNCGR